MSAETPLLEAAGLSRRFGANVALSDFSLRLRRGEMVALVGPNAAGKSTALRLLAARLKPQAGELRIDGRRAARRMRRRIGFLPQRLPVHPEMTVRESVAWAAAVYGIAGASRHAAVERVLDALDLEGVARRRVGNLSQGFRQRTALGQALAHDPDILILDEPTAGLDPTQAASLRQRLQTLRTGRAIVFSTHLAEDLRDGCDRVVALRAGRVAGSLSTRECARTLWLRIGRAPSMEALRCIDGVAGVQPAGDGGFRVTLIGSTSGEALLAEVLARKWDLLEWRAGDPGLDLLLEQRA